MSFCEGCFKRVVEELTDYHTAYDTTFKLCNTCVSAFDTFTSRIDETKEDNNWSNMQSS